MASKTAFYQVSWPPPEPDRAAWAVSDWPKEACNLAVF
jgi:hypothetical protein